jgi:hypothetical protein
MSTPIATQALATPPRHHAARPPHAISPTWGEGDRNTCDFSSSNCRGRRRFDAASTSHRTVSCFGPNKLFQGRSW